MIRLIRSYLVVVDISGYTRFITERTLSLSHAEQVITDLINAVLDQARDPMVLNKLEGDAALLFRETAAGDLDAARDVFSQVRAFFPAFHEKLAVLRSERSNCNCEACNNITDLKLKAFVHLGDIAVKQVRKFEEIAGEPVIMLHRMMKNTVDRREYVLATDAAVADARLPHERMQVHDENLESFGVTRLWLVDPQDLPVAAAVVASSPIDTGHAPRTGRFTHLPQADLSFYRRMLLFLSRYRRG